MKRKIEFNHASAQLEGPIVTWYHQLKNKTVAELEFHQHRLQTLGSRSDSNIVISLTDGSRYLLRRRIKHPNRSLVPHFVDTIQNVSSSGVTTLPLTRINFSKKSGKHPDLLFLLSICYGIQSHGRMNPIARLFIDDEFFALAVILNITRPISSIVSEIPASAHHLTPLECLWKEVHHSIQGQEHTFWGHTIANEAKNITRELIYRAARKKIVECFPQDDSASRGSTRSTAASIVARVESIIKKRDLNDSKIWDDAWNSCWVTVWEDAALDIGGWSAALRGVLPVEHIPGVTPRLRVEGRTPGSIAGRTPERQRLLMDRAAWLHSILIGSHPSLMQGEALNSKERRKEEQPVRGESRGAFDPRHEPQPYRSPVYPEMPSNGQDMLPRPSNVLPSEPQEYEIWASPREIAVHMAWEEAWPVAVSKGKELAQEMRDSKQRVGEDGGHQVHRTLKQPGKRFQRLMNRAVKATLSTRIRSSQTPPLHGNESQAIPRSSQSTLAPTQAPPSLRGRSSAAMENLRKRLLGPGFTRREQIEQELQDLVKERIYCEDKKTARYQVMYELCSAPDLPSDIKESKSPSQTQLKGLAEEAWRKRMTKSGGLSTKLNSLAEQAWQSMAEALGNFAPNDPVKAQWIEKFKSTWEMAWKESWMQAWKAVWDDAWDTAVARGAEFGVEEVFDNEPSLRRSNYEKLKLKPTYLNVEALINQGDHLSCLEQVRSMMKELYRLHESLQHSIPAFHDETLKITGYERNDVPMTKKFRRRRYVYIEERKPTYLSHYELQEWVDKHYIKKKFEDNKNAQRLFKRRIAQVWGAALSVYDPPKRVQL